MSIGKKHYCIWGNIPLYRLSGRMVFKRGKLGWLNKLILLLVPLTFQHTSKVNISDNNLNYLSTEKSYITFSYMKRQSRNPAFIF